MKKSIAFLVAIAFSLSLAACGGSADPEVSEPSADISAPEASVPGPDVPDYRLIDSSEYSRDGKDCVGYRVEIAEDASEEDMRAVFSELSAADAYYLHTVWYYGLASDVETIGSYTVGQLEEVAEGSEPVFTAPALSAAEIAALREGSAADRSIPAPTIKQEALVPENLFTPAPEELFSTPASENGLGDSAFYVEGKIEEVPAGPHRRQLRPGKAGHDLLQLPVGQILRLFGRRRLRPPGRPGGPHGRLAQPHLPDRCPV